ncbi:rhomboid family intramembrane serine protease [Pelagicoccus albus]|uniref:Rhomboid family intramembrane serine protease n=1 Tax=Pelagicoccus albus TaxID=415222 RepID=A0A7X1B9A8_9BACT|nr:rhomboid family intramembrane serine protease [Pelagicoccus albus]MBC2607719.1 rhomboid family intramembrane serine protease [Pelagicoccus albus]
MNATVTLTICIITGVITQIALMKPEVLRRLLFVPDAILKGQQWDRLFSSALIHADWMHAGFNLFALYSFGSSIEYLYGWKSLVVIYVFAVAGGSLLSLYLHRNQSYAALGASGGVSGVIFATIFLVPGTGVSLFFIPIAIPGNIFALLYLLGSFYGLRKKKGNIGHDAHFGGAIVGLVFAFLIRPSFCFEDPLFFFGSAFAAVACLVILYLDPQNLSGKLLPDLKGSNRRN